MRSSTPNENPLNAMKLRQSVSNLINNQITWRNRPNIPI